MSLDVSLYSRSPIDKRGTEIFIREKGATRELSLAEAKERYPDAVINEYEHTEEACFSANITHNLGEMADKAGIYEALWRPYKLRADYNIPSDDYEAECKFEEEVKIQAREIIPILLIGLKDLKARPEYFKQFDSPNGWGMYIHFVPFVEKYLNACMESPDAIIEVSR